MMVEVAQKYDGNQIDLEKGHINLIQFEPINKVGPMDWKRQ